MTNALRFPAADPSVAAEFFAAELAFEADPDDVYRDMQAATTNQATNSVDNPADNPADNAATNNQYVLVETRSPEAFAQARIPGAINLPYRDLPEQLDLDPSKVYICYCESFQCNAATKGALELARRGFRVKRLSGGITAWREAGYPIESDALAETSLPTAAGTSLPAAAGASLPNVAGTTLPAAKEATLPTAKEAALPTTAGPALPTTAAPSVSKVACHC